jgi:hydroxymethylbilane synthase
LDAVVLAAAGIRRMGYGSRISETLSAERFVPAIGQGALGVETREGDERVNPAVKRLDHAPSRICVEAERSFLKELHGGCQVPIGALGSIVDEVIVLRGMVAGIDGSPMIRAEIRGPVSGPVRLGVELAQQMLAQGAGEVLEALYAEEWPAPDLP